jgi:hypothetical protein
MVERSACVDDSLTVTPWRLRCSPGGLELDPTRLHMGRIKSNTSTAW